MHSKTSILFMEETQMFPERKLFYLVTFCSWGTEIFWAFCLWVSPIIIIKIHPCKVLCNKRNRCSSTGIQHTSGMTQLWCNLGVIQKLLHRDGPERPAERSSKSSAVILLAIFNIHILTVLFSHRHKLVAL